MAKNVLYICHVDEPKGSTWHYIGITTQARIRAREREHGKASGDSKVARAVANGATFSLHVIDHHADATTEAILQCFPEQALQAAICPVCKEQADPTMKGEDWRASLARYQAAMVKKES